MRHRSPRPSGRRIALKIFCLLMLPTLLSSQLSAQDGKWEMNLDTELKNPILSENGAYLVYGNDDAEAAECLDARTGRKLWSRPLKDFDKWQVMRFIQDSVVLMGQEKQWEFVRASDGTVIKTIPLIDGDWDDLAWAATAEEQMENIMPYVRSNIGIYYFDDGTQIIDLEKRELIHQTEDVPSKLQYKDWGNIRMIFPRGGSDSIWFVDYEKRKVIYSFSRDDHEMNESLYQPFAMNDTELILFNDENVESIDIATGRVNATMPIETGDPDFLFTTELEDGLHLMVSEDDVQTLYRTKDGKQLWATPKDTVPGVIDQLVEVAGNQGLLLGYKDGYGSVYKVDLKSGEIAWSRLLFKQKGDLETGHKEGSKFAAALKTFALRSMMNMVLGPGVAARTGYRYDPSTGLYSMSYRPFSGGSYDGSMSSRRAARQLSSSTFNAFLSKRKETKAYMSLITENESDVVLAVAGRAYEPENKKMSIVDGEGVYTIDLATGDLKTTSKATMLAEKEQLNAYNDMKLLKLPVAQASALVGINDLYIERKGEVERLAFGEETISFISSTDSNLVIMADNDGDEYHYWLVDAKTNPSTLHLLAQTEDPVLTFSDTTVFTQTLSFKDFSLSGHSLYSGKPGAVTLPSPMWTLSEDKIDEMGIGRLTKNEGHFDPIQGIRPTKRGLYLMGDDAIAFLSADGKCTWTREWSPNRQKITMPPTLLNGHLILAVGDEVQLLSDDCSGSVVAEYEIDFDDRSVLSSKEGTLIIMDADEGLIYGFTLEEESKL